MSLKIRPASREDIPLIHWFVRALASYERLEDEVVATIELLDKNLFGENSYAKTLIAEWEGTPAGFALYFYNFSTFLGQPGIYLEDLFVKPDFRGLGIGKSLLRELAHMAVEQGCGRLDWAVLDWNEPAIQFYKKIGSETQHEWTGFRLSGEALRSFAVSPDIAPAGLGPVGT